ncbi:MAG: thioredoxin family protein [Polyangiales bacterium]
MSCLRPVALVLVTAFVGCDAAPVPVRRDPVPIPARTAAPLPSATGPSLHFVAAPIATDLAAWISGQERFARAEGERVVVYLGASWCEPCQRFHQAVEARELDDKLPRTRFLQFDAEAHGEALAAIGYTSKYVPLFAIPGDDGRGTGKQISGSIKGPGAAEEIAPRLRALLEGKATQ